MIEHFSKWLDLVPLLDCYNERVVYEFLNMAFNKFGTPTKFSLTKVHIPWGIPRVVKALIDHRLTS
jgi:hypothetical protein